MLGWIQYFSAKPLMKMFIFPLLKIFLPFPPFYFSSFFAFCFQMWLCQSISSCLRARILPSLYPVYTAPVLAHERPSTNTYHGNGECPSCLWENPRCPMIGKHLSAAKFPTPDPTQLERITDSLSLYVHQRALFCQRLFQAFLQYQDRCLNFMIHFLIFRLMHNSSLPSQLCSLIMIVNCD